MPINIYRDIDPTEKIMRLCLDDWELPSQMNALEAWLESSAGLVAPGNIIADNGYSVRKWALGGGAVLTATSMKSFSEMG